MYLVLFDIMFELVLVYIVLHVNLEFDVSVR